MAPSGNRLQGVVDLVELAQRHEEAFGGAGDGLVQLLKDAAELLETIRAEIRARQSREETEENNEKA